MDIDPVGVGPGETWSPRLIAASVHRQGVVVSGAPAAPRSNETSSVDRSTLEERVSRANEELSSLRNDLRFSIHEKSGQMVMQIVDPASGEVLRQSPPQEFLDLSVRLREMVGVFLDETK